MRSVPLLRPDRRGTTVAVRLAGAGPGLGLAPAQSLIPLFREASYPGHQAGMALFQIDTILLNLVP